MGMMTVRNVEGSTSLHILLCYQHYLEKVRKAIQLVWTIGI